MLRLLEFKNSIQHPLAFRHSMLSSSDQYGAHRAKIHRIGQYSPLDCVMAWHSF